MSEVILKLGVNDVMYPDGTKLGDVAEWDEYGTETSPPRPANRMGLERAVKKNKKMVQGYLRNLTMAGLMKDKNIARKLSRERKIKLFTQIGRSARKETRDIIASGSTAPNAPATVKKKGFNHPLVETWKYHDNVNYEVQS